MHAPCGSHAPRMMGSDIACEVPRAAASEKTRVLDPEPQPEGGRCAWGDSNVILAIAQSLHPFRASQVSLSHCQRGWPCLSVDQARWTRALRCRDTTCEDRGAEVRHAMRARLAYKLVYKLVRRSSERKEWDG